MQPCYFAVLIVLRCNGARVRFDSGNFGDTADLPFSLSSPRQLVYLVVR
jgi:hypothetical protein